MQYDIFISYRRDGGDMTAHIIYERLSKMGYSVFQDIETLRSGKFNTAIYEKIEECKDFILILPPNSLERCVAEEDWVRKEIICALKNKKNIIPIMLRGFAWPSELPEEIREIQFFNGLAANTEYFEQFLERLTDFFESKPAISSNGTSQKKQGIRFGVTVVLVVLLLLLPLYVIYGLNQSFGLVWRLIYITVLILLGKWVLYEIETRPSIAAKCFGTVKEDELCEHPDVVYSRVVGAFGKDVLIAREQTDLFKCLYRLKRFSFGTWDGKRVNYLKILFRRKVEWYDPSVFYLHSLSKGNQALKMLTRQGFVLQSPPNFFDCHVDYLTKNQIHVFLFYKKKRLEHMEVFQCNGEELKEKYAMIGEIVC